MSGEESDGRDILWSPWRMEYILGEKSKSCVFCEHAAADEAEDEDRYVVYRGKTQFVVLNIWPYNNGHSMVVPYRHVADLTDLTDEESLEMIKLSQRLVTSCRKTMNAEGVNVGLNLGRVAGGSIEHIHLHLVPRWRGDANFMPVIGGTKVMVERLADTLKRLRDDTANWV